MILRKVVELPPWSVITSLIFSPTVKSKAIFQSSKIQSNTALRTAAQLLFLSQFFKICTGYFHSITISLQGIIIPNIIPGADRNLPCLAREGIECHYSASYHTNQHSRTHPKA